MTDRIRNEPPASRSIGNNTRARMPRRRRLLGTEIPTALSETHALRRRTLLSLPLVAAGVGLASCGFDDNGSKPEGNGPSSSSQGGSPAASGRKGLTDTLRQANRPVNHLNPAFSGGGSPQSTWLMSMMWEGLIDRDAKDTQKYLPGLAEKWEVSDDGLTYTFHLHADAKWSNGDPLTANDFVWTYSYYYSPSRAKEDNKYTPSHTVNPDVPYITGMLDYFSGKTTDFSTVGVKAPDDQTLVFTITAPDYKFLDGLARSYPLHRKSTEANPKDFWLPKHFVGNGPYKITSYTQNGSAEFELNENYHDADKFSVTHRTVNFNSSGSTGMMLSYNADEIDAFRVDGDPTALIAGRPDLEDQLQRATMTQFKGLSVLPCKNSVLQDNLKLRQALAMSVDRDALATASPPDVAGPSWAPSGVAGHDQLPKIPFDPDQAKQLLSDAGFPDGKGLPHLRILTYATMPVLEAVCGMWKKHLKISASVAVKEVGIYDSMRRGDLPDDFTGLVFNYNGITPVQMLALVGQKFNQYNYVPYDIAHQWYDLAYGKLKNKYPSSVRVEKEAKLLEDNWLPEYKKFQQLATQALAAQTDQEKSLTLAAKAATAFQESYLFVPLLWTGYTYMVKPRVHNYTLSSIADSMFSLEGVTLDPVKK